jgi:peptide/nickel transport system permease protein
LAAFPILLGISLVAFALGVIAPGDPAVEALSQNGFSQPTLEEIEIMRSMLGLDAPLSKQYVHWVIKAVQGDLGVSYMTGASVTGEILRRLPYTFNLSLLAICISMSVGLPMGILMAMKNNTMLDNFGRVVAIAFVSIPGFWLAILLITFFAENLQLLPTSGYGTWTHLILPAVVLATGTTGVIIRLSRAAILEVLNENYILTAKAKGLSAGIIFFKHAFLNSLTSVVTLLGTYFGNILGGSVIVEVIFAIPGIGAFAVDGIYRRDYPVIQGYVVFTGLVFIIFNLFIDLVYMLINPQVKLGGQVK